MSTDNREDYLLNILRLTDGEGVVKTTELSNYMGVAPASVTEMVKALSKEGYVNYEKYRGVSLTEKGLVYARGLRRRHHILERFLNEVLEVDHQDAHDQACAAEHSISDESVTKMCRMIGTRVDNDCSTCPDPCTDSGLVTSVCTSLSEMNAGEHGIISHISSKDENTVRKLISMGFVPGRSLTVSSIVSSEGARIVRIGNTSIALDKELAVPVHIAKD